MLDLINTKFSNYNETVKDYEEVDITDIFDFETGIEPGSKNYSEVPKANYIKFYRVGDMNSKCKTFISSDIAESKIINSEDILVSFDATVGRIAYGLNGSFSTGMKKVSINKKYKDELDNSIVFAYFNNKDVQNIIKQNARGTTILHASSAINYMKFKYNKTQIMEYSKFISILFKKMKQIKKENDVLIELRDTLLPKLMNGEIDLENIEI